MSGVNKVIIIGNVCNDIDVKFMPNGNAVANMSVATSESWKDKNTSKHAKFYNNRNRRITTIKC